MAEPGRTEAATRVASALCPTCGRWHDQTGQPVLGWNVLNYVTGRERFWPLPAGCMPIAHAEADPRVYGSCGPGAKR